MHVKALPEGRAFRFLVPPFKPCDSEARLGPAEESVGCRERHEP